MRNFFLSCHSNNRSTLIYYLTTLHGRWRYILLMLLMVPLLMSYVIKIYAIRGILGSSGILNATLVALGILDRPSTLFVFNMNAILLTLTLLLIPFAILPIFLTLERIPQVLLCASEDLGANSTQTPALTAKPWERAIQQYRHQGDEENHASRRFCTPPTQLTSK